MKVLGVILVLLILLIVGALLYGWRRTYKVEHSSNGEQFRRGTVDASLLDGNYDGRVTGYTGAWQGKTFHQNEHTGINRFRENDTMVNRYPFATYVGKSLSDPALDVIKLDYNQPGNPWWLRFIVDEIVSVEPTTYLGKVYIQIVPGIHFSMGYFTLEKSTSQE